MYTLAPSLFFAIFFGWAPWPYSGTARPHRKNDDIEVLRPR
jgi:hypothetical protein